MPRWTPSAKLQELMAEGGWLAPVVADSAVECLTEWLLRYQIDNEAEEAGILKAGSCASASTHMRAALQQCRDQGLDLNPHE